MTLKRQPILIAGAGIAGLTAAIYLKRCGFTPQIIEKSPEVTTEGAGIQITPNAFNVLSQLGLQQNLLDCGYLPSTLNIHSYDNNAPLLSIQLQKAMQKKGPYLLIKRQDLLNCLFKEAQNQNIQIEFNKPYENNIEENRPLIGADGVWSSVRNSITQKEAIFSGRIAFRAMIEEQTVPDWVNKTGLSMMMGPNAHFVYYPVDKSNTFNLVFIITEKLIDKHWSSPASPHEIAPHLKNWPPHIVDLILSVENWKKWPLFGVKPEDKWCKENKVLIGDAAHAMVPFLAQGGAMAIEDAVVLAHEITKTPSISQAFMNYENARKKRIPRVWHEAFNNGKRYHWQGYMAKSRNVGLKLMGEKALLKRYDWIYDWQPPSL